MVGGKLGPFEICELLGAGGMGEVYRARDQRLGREVAIKVLRSELLGDPERRDRFQREARLLAALDHPGIVTVHAIEEVDGQSYLVMQLVEGETLDRLIPESGLPLEQFFEIAVPLAEAVAAAHERGIVHRDLKPANVMRSREGWIKVLDFGLAKLVEPRKMIVDREASTELLTREGIVVGTLPYMAPEQLEGRELDSRSDVFALGVVLYEMVTGRRPFAGPTTPALISSILTTEPADVGEFRQGVPDPIRFLLRRCLAKDPGGRPATAAIVRDELRAARSSAAQERGARVAGTVGARQVPSSIAVLPFSALSSDRDDEFFADGVSEEIINALGRLPALRVAARTSTFAFKGKHEDLRQIGERLGVGAVLEGSVRRSGVRLRIVAQLIDVASGYQLWSERFDRELEDVFEIQDEIAHSIAKRLEATLDSGDSAPAEWGRRDVDAFELHARGRSLMAQRTEEAIRRATDCFREAAERDPSYALAWSGLAASIVLQVDYYGHAEPEAQLSRAQRALDQALAIAPDLAEAHATLGMLLYRRRDGPGSLRELQRAVELRPSFAEAHGLLGWMGMVMGRTEIARAGTFRAVQLDPLSPEAHSHLPLLLLGEGRVEEAMRAAEAALALEPGFTTVILYRAVVLLHAGDLDGCRRLVADLSVPWAGSAPEAIQAIAGAIRGEQDEARATARALSAGGEADLAGVLFGVIGDLDAAYEAFSGTPTYGYWSMLCLHLLFPVELAALRDDPRYPGVVAAIDRQWGFHGSRGADGTPSEG